MARTTEAGRFIGRSAELVRLDDALSAAVGGGGGRTVVIGGEAGIGKTWLLERFATAAKERGAHVLAGACLEVGGHGVPYAPFVEALRGLVRSVDPGRLPAVLGPDRRQLARLLPELGDRPGTYPISSSSTATARHACSSSFSASSSAWLDRPRSSL